MDSTHNNISVPVSTHFRGDETPVPSVGCSISYQFNATAQNTGIEARGKALRDMPWLIPWSFNIGPAQVTLWGLGDPVNSVTFLNDGSLVFLVGSPQRNITWCEAMPGGVMEPTKFILPWEGRLLFVHLSADGREWSIWTDWCGSVQLFVGEGSDGIVLSTLEPETVAATGMHARNVSHESLVQLLALGHFLGNDSLYTGITILPADTRSHFVEGELNQVHDLQSVAASEDNFQRSRTQLVDDMTALTEETIDSALKRSDLWTLPLSGGVDSRLIAQRASSKKVACEAVTYGPDNWIEVTSARAVAEHLNLDWQRVNIPPSYLVDYTDSWLNWFGTSLHAHGMYQFPFLQAAREIGRPVINGFMGDPLAGNHIAASDKAGSSQLKRAMGYEPVWGIDGLQYLLDVDVHQQLEAISQKLETQYAQLSGESYQRQMFMDFRNRQRRFISYQPLMYDYSVGISTPFMDRTYANFCMSLPRQALTNRSLQLEMTRLIDPELFQIKGTFTVRRFPSRLGEGIKTRIQRIMSRVPGVTGRIPGRLLPQHFNSIQPNALKREMGVNLISEKAAAVLADIGFRPEAVRSLQTAYTTFDDTTYTRLRSIQPLSRVKGSVSA